MIKSGIYKIENKMNGKVYIGSSYNIQQRMDGHKSLLKKTKHPNQYLQNSFDKYGLNNFVFEKIELINAENKLLLNKELKKKEAYYIELYKSFNNEFGYNIMGAKEGRIIFSDKMKQNISKHKKDYYKNHPEQKERLSEQAKKIHTGRKRNQQTKNKISKALKGNKNGLGRIVTEEIKQKLRMKRLGIFKHTKESKEKISKSSKGRTPWNKGRKNIYTEETLKKIKNARARQIMPKWTKERYEKMKNKMPTNKGIPAWNRKKVIQLLLNGEILNIFNSLKEASIITKAPQSNICDCCKNKQKTSGGFRWMYEKDYENNLIETLLSA